MIARVGAAVAVLIGLYAASPAAARPALPSLAVARSHLTEVLPVDVTTDPLVVPVPGAYEAAVTDQMGSLALWRLEPGRPWREVAVTRYPTRRGGSRYAPASVSALPVPGTRHAIFALVAQDGAEGSDVWQPTILYTLGRDGWGSVRPDAAGHLVATGEAVDAAGPAILRDASVEDGQLVVTTTNRWTLGGYAQDRYPIVTTWRWTGSRFDRTSTDVVTAQLTAAPGPARATGACPTSLSDGTYAGRIVAVDPGIPWDDARSDSVTVWFGAATGGPGCAVPVAADAPLTLPASDSAGSPAWVGAPAWLLAAETSMPAAASAGTRYDASDLRLTALTVPTRSDLSGAPRPEPLRTYAGQVVVRDHRVVALFLDRS